MGEYRKQKEARERFQFWGIAGIVVIAFIYFMFRL